MRPPSNRACAVLVGRVVRERNDMSNPVLKVPSRSLVRVFVCLILLIAGCQTHPGKSGTVDPSLSEIKKLVVVGFRPALAPGEESGIIRTAISGAVFMAEPVPQPVADRLTSRLVLELSKDGRFELIPPGQARGMFSRLLSSDAAQEDLEIIREIGQAFSANGVLVGYAYRWHERQGTDYAVDKPASVAFDLYLIRPADGRTIWKGRFDKTQHSLSENLFDIETFLKGKGKWMRAEELGNYGLELMLRDLSGDAPPKKD